MNTQVFVDEWAIAADCLADNGFASIAESIRDMRNRVLSCFLGENRGESFDCSRPFISGGWSYYTDRRLMIRIRTDQPDEPRPKLNSVLKVWNEYWHVDPDYSWEPLPGHDPDLQGDDLYTQFVVVNSRRLSQAILRLVNKLPEPEYQPTTEDYKWEEYFTTPLPFRFRFGEGIAMPLGVSKER